VLDAEYARGRDEPTRLRPHCPYILSCPCCLLYTPPPKLILAGNRTFLGAFSIFIISRREQKILKAEWQSNPGDCQGLVPGEEGGP